MAHPERVPPRCAARLVRSYVTAPAFEEANAAMRAAVFSGIERIDAPVTLAWAELDRLVAEPRGGVPGARRVILRRLRSHPHLGRPAAGQPRAARGSPVRERPAA